MEGLGLWPLPMTFKSSMGVISPLTGWKALCIYVYEVLTGDPLKARLTGGRRSRWARGDLGPLVARELYRLFQDGLDISTGRRIYTQHFLGCNTCLLALDRSSALCDVGRRWRNMVVQLNQEAFNGRPEA